MIHGYSKSGLVLALIGGILVDVATNKTITNNNVTLTNDHNGRADRGLNFAGVDTSFLDCGVISFDRLVPFTYVIGFNRAAENTIYNLLSNQGDASTYRGQVLAVNAANTIQLLLRSTTSGSNRIIVNSVGTLGAEKNLIIVSYSGSGAASGVKMNLNSVEDACFILDNNLTATTATVHSTLLGKRTIGTTSPFAGMIDLALIYNRELTLSEKLQTYNYWFSH